MTITATIMTTTAPNKSSSRTSNCNLAATASASCANPGLATVRRPQTAVRDCVSLLRLKKIPFASAVNRMPPHTMKSYAQFLLGIFVTLCFTVTVAQPAFAGEERDIIGPGSFRPDALPFLRTGVQTHQFCTYDRAGDNFDWEYFPLYTDTNGECVIFDAMGPGCLYRQHMNIWGGATNYNSIQIRFYFDDESKPRIDMDVSTFFSTNNPLGIFQQPVLAFDGKDPLNGKDRFRILYHPFFFKQRLKIALSSEPGGPPTVLEPWTRTTKHPDWNGRHFHWYQYTYQLFTDDPGLDSWTSEAGRRMVPVLLDAWNVTD